MGVMEMSQEKRKELLESIVSRFKRGEVDLPSCPQVSLEFRELMGKNTSYQEIASILKRDVAITVKLISVANSSYYRGVTEVKSLEDALGRLGLYITRRYVDAISSKELYITKSQRFAKYVEKLWTHSYSCALAYETLKR